ncbi:hypothetical protein BCL90_0004 [Pedobacter alluvionis]|uniref:Uncharacterized protein n=1 Tax=Pedobacter alluvionis TaxID=475253 RepID=A0A497YBA2_9SPHI|nr:hypothetical protein [Pedobacter alluvionis]RLJ80985.1 hypothetical protein BCL90_0004 [Pedobacter alluvionis]
MLATTGIYAQQVNGLLGKALTERTQPAPESVFRKFREAGMKPVNHILTVSEKEKLNKAFSFLPPLHQKILKEHLSSVSFMDNMPNTALTSPVETTGPEKMFNITFRAEILNQTISEWATWKENSCYVQPENNDYQVTIEAGKLDAMVYILLHEATHVVDAVLNITPHPDDFDALVAPTPFTADIWSKINKPKEKATSALLETTRFRSGKPVLISSAQKVYEALKETPFASLYSMASWHEDLAEILTIYHLTQKMGQPYRILVNKNGVNVFVYEPFINKQVINRQSLLAMFYTPYKL